MNGSVILEKFVINGGVPLKGEVFISGAKNAAVAIIPAVLLSNSACIIENVPNISDVKVMVHILREMGAYVKFLDKNTIEIDPRGIDTDSVPADLARHLRGSYYFLGALLAKYGKASAPLPGGCNFCVRPIDQHIKGFEALGCEYNLLENGIIEITSNSELVGSNIYMDVSSVGATINIMLAATKANGITVIENAAREPHVVDLANFLNTMGADIRGAGTDVIKIHGVKSLKGVTYSIIPDQIEAGTYMVAAAATGGDVLVRNVTPKHLESISAKLEEMGVEIEEYDDAIRVTRKGELKKCNVKTMPHPGFPTDMQPQIVSLLSCAGGISMINESVWETRYQYVDELKRMGAKVTVNGRVAVVEGVSRLKGAPVKATDLRAGAALMIAGLMAKGTTYVEDVRYIQRGYEDIVEKFVKLGADIHCQNKPYEEFIFVG